MEKTAGQRNLFSLVSSAIIVRIIGRQADTEIATILCSLLFLLASGSANRQRYKSAMCDFFIEHAYDLECRDATHGFSNCCERKQRPPRSSAKVGRPTSCLLLSLSWTQQRQSCPVLNVEPHWFGNIRTRLARTS